MSETPKPPRIEPSQELIDQVVARLQAVLDERAFANLLADSIKRKVDSEERAALQAAFRDPRLINRSVAAADYLTSSTNAQMRAIERELGDGSDRSLRERTAAFQNMVGQERQLLRRVLSGLKAQRGFPDNAPNPRRRAMNRLVTENMRGDVPKGRFRELLEEEEERDREAKRAAKQRALEAKRAARAAGDSGAQRQRASGGGARARTRA